MHSTKESLVQNPLCRLTYISELIDIDQLICQKSSSTDLSPDNILFTKDLTTTDDETASLVMIQFPSRHILSPQQYLERSDRVMTLEKKKNLIQSNMERRIQVHKSRKGLRAKALCTPRALLRGRKSSADKGRNDKKDVFVLAEESVGPDLANKKESFNPKRK